GGLACVLGGFGAQKFGTKRLAATALSLSGLCCLLAPLMFMAGSEFLFLAFLLFWGMVVIADSPLFSTLVARHAPKALKGTALTIVNSIGFFITIISIQVVQALSEATGSAAVLMILAVGPIMGLLALRTSRDKHSDPAS
ncbi:MAG: MFS transporter, partial [Bacteroidota bacterium]